MVGLRGEPRPAPPAHRRLLAGGQLGAQRARPCRLGAPPRAADRRRRRLDPGRRPAIERLGHGRGRGDLVGAPGHRGAPSLAASRAARGRRRRARDLRHRAPARGRRAQARARPPGRAHHDPAARTRRQSLQRPDPVGRVRKVDRERPADPEENVWNITAAVGRDRLPIALPEANVTTVWRRGAHEVALVRGRLGRAAISERQTRPRLTDARWAADGTLEVAGELEPDVPLGELVFYDEDRNEAHAFPVERDPDSGRFTAALSPARIEYARRPAVALAGDLASQRPRRRAGVDGTGDPPALDQRRCAPTSTTSRIASPRVATAARCSTSCVGSTTTSAARYHQRRLRATPTPPTATGRCATRSSISSFGGRQYSDSPRAIHEEMRAPRRAARASVGGARRPLPCHRRRDDRPARGQPRVPRGARRRALRDRQRPLPDLVRPPRRTRRACRPGTAHRSSASASTCRRRARRSAASSTAGSSRWPTGSTWSPPTASRRRSCGARTRSRARCSRRAIRATTSSPGPATTRRGARCAAAGDPRRRAYGALRADVPRQRARPTRPLPDGPAPGHRPPAGGGGRGHRDPLPQAPLRRRRRPGHARRLRARRLELSRTARS